VVAVDPDNDVALIRVPGLPLPPLRLAASLTENGQVAMVGYPEGHGLTPVAGRIGRVIEVLGPDAYGSHVHLRPVVPLRGLLRHGDSGGPVLNPAGRVAAVMFAADQRGQGGYGVPLSAVKALVSGRLGHADVGPCGG
jgi:S1-C subfamily serine protease